MTDTVEVVGAGDTTIQGFATDISVNHGQTVSFKINDQALAAYHIDIYRLGYYGGAGARKVATISSSQTTPVVQPAPLTDAATKLVDHLDHLEPVYPLPGDPDRVQLRRESGPAGHQLRLELVGHLPRPWP